MSNGFEFDLWAIGFAALIAGAVWWVTFLLTKRLDKPADFEQRPHLTIVKTPEDWAENDSWGLK